MYSDAMIINRCFSISTPNLECVKDKSERNDGDGDYQLAPVLQMTQVVVE